MSKLHITTKFGVVPNELLNDPNISFKAKGLYAFLQSKPDGWKFSVERIAKQTQDGERAVRSGLQELEKHGWLERVLVREGTGFKGYDYILHSTPLQNVSLQNVRTQNVSTQNRHDISKKDNSKKDIVKKNIDNKNAQAELEHLFDEFWKEYPRKVAKKVAKQKFIKILKQSKDYNITFQEIMQGLQKYKNTPQWKKDNGAYIPHPSTWLNQERWQDEIVTNKCKKIIDLTQEAKPKYKIIEKDGKFYKVKIND